MTAGNSMTHSYIGMMRVPGTFAPGSLRSSSITSTWPFGQLRLYDWGVTLGIVKLKPTWVLHWESIAKAERITNGKWAAKGRILIWPMDSSLPLFFAFPRSESAIEVLQDLELHKVTVIWPPRRMQWGVLTWG
jgi:hypothetical protein